MADTITPEVLSNGVNIPPVDTNGAVSTTDEVISVKDLAKTITGQEFPDDETALKSLQDTHKWATQNAQKVKTLEQQLQQTASSPDLQKQVADLSAEMKANNFYQAHPELNISQIKAVINKMGGPSEELLQDEVFKSTSAAITQSLAMDKSKSILHTNPRLGMMQDSLTKASEASKAGNVAQAADLATAAVLEAYPDIASKN